MKWSRRGTLALFHVATFAIAFVLWANQMAWNWKGAVYHMDTGIGTALEVLIREGKVVLPSGVEEIDVRFVLMDAVVGRTIFAVWPINTLLAMIFLSFIITAMPNLKKKAIES